MKDRISPFLLSTVAAGLVLTLAWAQAPPSSLPWPQGRIPITGSAGPGLEALDQAMVKIMDRHGIPGGSLAIAKDGKLVYAKGFGWANLSTGTPARLQRG